MAQKGKAVDSFDRAILRTYTLLGSNRALRNGPDENLIADLVLEGLQRAVGDLDVPFMNSTATITLVADQPTYDITTSTSARVMQINSVQLIDAGATPDEYWELEFTTPSELLRTRGKFWREVDGQPTHWMRTTDAADTTAGGLWNEKITLYPWPDADAVTDWPEVKVNVVLLDFFADGNATSIDASESHELLLAAAYHATAEYLSTKRDDGSFRAAQMNEAKYNRTIDKFKKRIASEPSDTSTVPYFD